MDGSIVALEYEEGARGKSLSETKVQYTWRLLVEGQPYHVMFTNSRTSGKRRIYVDGHLIHEQKVYRAANFNYSWPISRHLLSIVPAEQSPKSGGSAISSVYGFKNDMLHKVDCSFELRIDGLPFRHYPTLAEVKQQEEAIKAAHRKNAPKKASVHGTPPTRPRQSSFEQQGSGDNFFNLSQADSKDNRKEETGGYPTTWPRTPPVASQPCAGQRSQESLRSPGTPLISPAVRYPGSTSKIVPVNTSSKAIPHSSAWGDGNAFGSVATTSTGSTFAESPWPSPENGSFGSPDTPSVFGSTLDTTSKSTSFPSPSTWSSANSFPAWPSSSQSSPWPASPHQPAGSDKSLNSMGPSQSNPWCAEPMPARTSQARKMKVTDTEEVWPQQAEGSSPRKAVREALPTHLIPWEPLPTPPPPAPPGAVGAVERSAMVATADRTDTASVDSTASSNDLRQAHLSLADTAPAQVQSTTEAVPIESLGMLGFSEVVDPEEIAEQEAILASIATSQSGIQEPLSTDRFGKNIHGDASMDWPKESSEWGSGTTGKAAAAPVTQAWPSTAADPWTSNTAWPSSTTASDPWACLPEIEGAEKSETKSPKEGGRSPARGTSRQALLSQMGMGVSIRSGRRQGPHLENNLPEALSQRLEQRESLLG